MKKIGSFGVVWMFLVLFAFAGVFAPASRAEGVTKVVVGNSQSYLIFKGQVYAWGWENLPSKIYPGNGNIESDYVPQLLPGISEVKDLQSVDGVTCALAKGEVNCWGEGYPAKKNHFTITASMGEVVAFSLTAKGLCVASRHRLACRSMELEKYKLKESVEFLSDSEFVKNFLNPITQVAMTSEHICVISGQKIYCGGEYYFWRGIRGKQSKYQFDSPILEDKSFVQISSGTSYLNRHFQSEQRLNQFCARTIDGEVYCWGDTNYSTGQVWDLNFADRRHSSEIFLVESVGNFDKDNPATDVATVSTQACAVQNGKLYFWGKPLESSAAQAGRNIDFILNPVLIPGLRNVKSVAISETHVCALASDGVYCFGYNKFGQLGRPDSNIDANPQKVAGLPDVSDHAFYGQNIGDAFKDLKKIVVAQKSQILDRVSNLVGHAEGEGEKPSNSIMKRKKILEAEFAKNFAILSVSPIFDDFAPELGTEAITDLEKVYATYQAYVHDTVGIQNEISNLSVIPYSNPVAAAAREMLDASLRALNGVSGEANVEAYQNLLAEVSKTQDLRSVVQLVDAQREWIENTAASNQSKRCFAQMVLNITEYLRGNL